MPNPALQPAAEPNQVDSLIDASRAFWRMHRWISVGIAISLPIHLSLMIWLAAVVTQRIEPAGSTPHGVDVALLPEAELARLGDSALSESAQPMVESMQGVTDPLDLPDQPVAGGGDDGSGEGMLATGGAGGGSGSNLGPGNGTGRGDPGMGTGGGGTTFFGIRARGTRFGYVIDKSGSMAQDGRWTRLGDELLRSLKELSEQASFSIAFFDTSPRAFPSSGDPWERARRAGIDRFTRWARTLSPGGGTEPVYGFNHLLSLDVPPDAIFFMTDGEIPPEQGSSILAKVLRRARPIAVHCILFQDRSPALIPEGTRSRADQEIDARLLRRTESGDMERLVGIALDLKSDGTPMDLAMAMRDRLNTRILQLLAQETGGAFRLVPYGGTP